MKHALLFIMLLLFNTAAVMAQDVYKTPSGEKYHLSSCRMVKNVSEKVALKSNELKTLEPCKICKPPAKAYLVQSLSNPKNAAGTGVTVQCNGKTKAGTRCKHKTSIANGYCYQHTAQASTSKPAEPSRISPSSTTGTCGAKNKTGGYCKRKVKGGGRCYQH